MIVAGCINVDLIVGVSRLPRPGETVHGHRFVQQGGGKAANQAVAAARMGAEVTLLGAVGDDDLGRAALEGLVREGVDTAACRRVAGAHTGLALIVVDDAGENQIAVAPGANARVDAEMIRSSVAGLQPRPGAVCLLTLELANDAVLALVRWAAERGLRVVINPAPARPLPDEVLAVGPILTPNGSEAAQLTAADEPGAAAEILAARTGAPVIVSLGGDGAVLWSDGALTVLPAMPVEAVDTTGAGDALNGILAAELAGGAPLDAALRMAMVGAAISTTMPGAQAGLPTREAIMSALDGRR